MLAAAAVDTVSVAWQARDVVTWPTSAAARPGAAAQLAFHCDHVPDYGTSPSTTPSGPRRPYHTRPPSSSMKLFPASVKVRTDKEVGGREHTRGAAIKVEEGDDDKEEKDQPKEKPEDKEKGNDKAKDEPKEKAKDNGQRKEKLQTTMAPPSQKSSQSPIQQLEQSMQPRQGIDVRAMADEVVHGCKDAPTQQMSVTLRDCVPSVLAKVMSEVSKSKAETLIGG